MSGNPKNPEIPGSEIPADLLFVDDTLGQMNARSEALGHVLELLVQDISYSDFCREILVLFVKSVPSEAASLLEVDHNSQSLFFRAVVGQSSDILSEFRVPVGQGIAGHVVESLRPLVVGNASEDPRHIATIAKAVGFDVRNLIAIPILVRGRVYGVLELLNRIGEPCYGPEDTKFLAQLCHDAGKAIEARMMIAWAAMQKERKAA